MVNKPYMNETNVNYSDCSLMNKVTVVIPTLNEADAIGKVIDELTSNCIKKENILVVDGGSNDGTVEKAKLKGVKVIFQNGKGKADALKSSIPYIKTPYVVVIDGDYTYPANYIPKLIKKLARGYDLVIGWRQPEPGAQNKVFLLGNRILTNTFNLLFRTKLNDILSGMYAIKKDILELLPFESKGFGIESEIVAYTISTGGRVAEVKITYRKRIGVKKLQIKHGFYILWEIIRLGLSYNPTFMLIIIMLVSILIFIGMVGALVTSNILVLDLTYQGILLILIMFMFSYVSVLSLINIYYIKKMELRLLSLLKRRS